jgi:hypothetical protein
MHKHTKTTLFRAIIIAAYLCWLVHLAQTWYQEYGAVQTAITVPSWVADNAADYWVKSKVLGWLLTPPTTDETTAKPQETILEAKNTMGTKRAPPPTDNERSRAQREETLAYARLLLEVIISERREMGQQQ